MSNDLQEYLKPGKKNLILIYILYLCGVIIPLLPIVGAGFAYVNKDHENKVWQSHYIFAIRTFLFCILGLIIAIITTFILIGPILYMLVLAWFIIRSILALQLLMSGMPHPNPESLWIK